MHASKKIKRMAPKSVLRECGKGSFYLQDQLSELPDDLLISILSLLPMKEAARTSVLSCRWRYLWTYAIRTLDFNAWQFFSNGLQSAATPFDFERNKFIEWVNKVLVSLNVPTIDKFSVFFNLDGDRLKPYLNSWIKFALEKKIRRLELDFMSVYGLTLEKSKYVLALPLLQNCKLDSLTRIRLASVIVTEEVVEYILSCCPFLDCLALVNINSLVNLQVSGPSLKLKHLGISYCDYIKRIQISAPSLVCFKYNGPKAKIVFKDVPCLMEAAFGGDYVSFLLKKRHQNLPCLSQLRTLELDVFDVYGGFLRIPKLRNLKEVQLDFCASQIIDVLCFMSPLKACRMMHRFSMRIYYSRTRKLKMKPKMKRKMKLKHAHKRLKVIELIGFSGLEIETELIWYMINNTVALEKIVIDPRQAGCSKAGHVEMRDEEAARSCARHLIKSLPTGLELVIL